MKFLADECCDGDLVAALRADGYDIEYVPEIMSGSPDEDILDYAFQTERIVITEDKDFGELVYRLKLPSRGIVLIRIGSENNVQKTLLFREVISRYGDRLYGLFVTLETTKIRARNLL